MLKHNSSTTTIQQRNYVVVKFQDIEYPFDLTFNKGTKIYDALGAVGIVDVVKIYEVENRQSKEVKLDDEINHDSTFKVQLR